MNSPPRWDLAKIHIAKKELGLTDSLYREVLSVFFGKRSAKDLNPREVEALLEHFKGLGWTPRPAGGYISGRSATPFHKKYDDLGDRPRMATPAQLRKIETLWMTGPGVRMKTFPALRHFLAHYFQISDLRFVKADPVTPIIAAVRHS